MKKLLIGLILSSLVLTGCGSQKVKIVQKEELLGGASSISFLNATSAQQSGTSVAFNAGSADNRFLVVSIFVRSNTTCTITYAGVSMTEVGHLTATVNSNDKIYLFVLTNPASGSNNIVITHNGTLVRWQAASYGGVNQTTSYGNYTTHSSSNNAPQSVSVTPSAAGWIVGGCDVGGSGFDPDSNTTGRGELNASRVFDSNADKTSAYAIGYQNSDAGDLLAIAVYPATAPTGQPFIPPFQIFE